MGLNSKENQELESIVWSYESGLGGFIQMRSLNSSEKTWGHSITFLEPEEVHDHISIYYIWAFCGKQRAPGGQTSVFVSK